MEYLMTVIDERNQFELHDEASFASCADLPNGISH